MDNEVQDEEIIEEKETRRHKDNENRKTELFCRQGQTACWC